MNREIIDSRLVLPVMMTVIIIRLFMPYPSLLAARMQTAAWLGLIIAGLPVIPLFWWMSRELARYPGESLVHVLERGYGKVLGIAVGLFLALWLALTIVMMGRKVGESIKTTVMPDTPLSVLLGTLALLAVWLVLRGVEPMARTHRVLITPYVLSMVAILVVVVPRYGFINAFFPIWGPGLDRLILLGLEQTGLFGLAVIALVYNRVLADPGNLPVRGTLILVVTMLIMAVVALALGLIFPFPAAARLSFPLFEAARLVSLGSFFQRVEALFVVLWFTVAVLAIAALGFAFLHVLAELLRLKDYRPLVPSTALILYTAAFIPKDVLVASRLDFTYLTGIPGAVVSLGLPAVGLLLARLRTRARKEGPAA